MIANVSTVGKGSLAETHTVILPSHLQPGEMRAARSTSSWWVDHGLTLPTGSELERGAPCSAHCQKAGFQGGFPCPRGWAGTSLWAKEPHPAAHTSYAEKHWTLDPLESTPLGGGLVASFQILVLFEVEFCIPMGVVSQSIPSEHGWDYVESED